MLTDWDLGLFHLFQKKSTAFLVRPANLRLKRINVRVQSIFSWLLKCQITFQSVSVFMLTLLCYICCSIVFFDGKMERSVLLWKPELTNEVVMNGSQGALLRRTKHNICFLSRTQSFLLFPHHKRMFEILQVCVWSSESMLVDKVTQCRLEQLIGCGEPIHLHDASKEGDRRGHQHSLLVSGQAFKPRDVERWPLVWDQPGDRRANHQTEHWKRTFGETGGWQIYLHSNI